MASPYLELIAYVLEAEFFYTALMPRGIAHSSLSGDAEPGLGGCLFYAGEFDAVARPMVVAANVAGAATLTATADLQAQRQVIREGVVDFLVTSLDEALRILKNEIRKRERVAVCVGAAPSAVESEMLERGVQPDLLRSQLQAKVDGHSRAAAPSLIWSVDTAPAQWLPKLDAVALECLDALQMAERRWVRNAPRHLGRAAFGLRVLTAGESFALCFAERIRACVESGEIGTAVTLQRKTGDLIAEERFTPRY